MERYHPAVFERARTEIEPVLESLGFTFEVDRSTDRLVPVAGERAE
jgi:hypothetical protein